METNNSFLNILRSINDRQGTIPSANPQLDIDGIADSIIRGNWGNGEERRKLLTGYGFNYDEVQEFVNRKLKGTLTAEDYQRDFIIRQPDTQHPYYHDWVAGEADLIPTTQGDKAQLLPNAETTPSSRPAYGRTGGVMQPEAVVELNEKFATQKPYYTNNGRSSWPNPFLATLLSLFPRQKK